MKDFLDVLYYNPVIADIQMKIVFAGLPALFILCRIFDFKLKKDASKRKIYTVISVILLIFILTNFFIMTTNGIRHFGDHL